MTFLLDDLDASILSILLVDARTSFVEIAKLTQTSTNTIRTRYNKLKENGVIIGATIQIKPKLLGHQCIGQILIHTDFKEKKKFCENLLRLPGILGSSFQIGEFNYTIFFSLKNFQDLDELVAKINQHPNVKRTSLAVCVGEIKVDHPKNLIIEAVSNSRKNKKSDCVKSLNTKQRRNLKINKSYLKKNSLDKIDYEIINILLQDARIPFNKIAQRLSISNQAVIVRYNRLKESVIHNSTITISLEKIGYIGVAIFRLKLSTDYPAALVFKKILATKNVIIAYRTLGDFQIMAGIPFKKMEELESHYIKFSKKPGVIEVQLFFPKIFPEWPVNTFSKISK